MLQASVMSENPLSKGSSTTFNVGSCATPKKRTFDEANVDASKQANDDSKSENKLPRELRDMFGPLTCKLCNVTATSSMMSKAHYSGKPHEKRVRQYLEKWSEETGNPMPKISKPETKVRQDTTYCKTCDIILTSVSVAQQHYAGKNHYKAIMQGGKIKKTENVIVPNDGRFGIGIAFLKSAESKNNELPSSDNGSVDTPKKQRTQPIETKNRVSSTTKNKLFSWSCDLCSVIAHSEDQLNMHLKGAKHLKSLKRSQTPSIIPAPVNPSESILASVIHPSDKNMTDYSMFRTPSGNYYCQPCNVTVKSADQISLHVESKKHKFKYATARSKKSPNTSIKTSIESIS